MIKIARTKCPDHLDPNNPKSPGQKELARITKRIEKGEVVKSTHFSAYGDRSVREALRDMFNGKCAYCERQAAGGQDGDVEHYRPKKGVTEADDAGIEHPGYWWLAAHWENLVLSCMHCNQFRSKQNIIPDDVVTLAELEAFLKDPPDTGTGKLNSFPTQDGVWVTDPAGDIASEKPLIIDPSADVDPEDHLEWVIFDGASTVRAKGGSAAGEASRKILGLNRRWLEEERRAKIALMRIQRNTIIDAMQNWLNADNPDVKAVWGQVADRAIHDLWAFTDEAQPFIGLARAFIKTVQDEVELIRPSDTGAV
ncbi:MAG: hypothetical protein AAF700_00215 [Pseudomonadota bacterium]